MVKVYSQLLSFSDHSLDLLGGKSTFLTAREKKEMKSADYPKPTGKGETYLVMTMDSDLPVALSTAETFKIPLAIAADMNARSVLRTSGYISPNCREQPSLTVNLESHLDLRLTSWSRRDVGQIKLAQHVVIFRHGSFTLVDLNLNGRLVVDGGGEDLRFLGGDDRVSGNELGHDTTGGFDTY